ncbi:hypothetical protein [Halomonas heilongjiangensis]|uniref:Uncharacterized protein n=1 Tax=Halomonas heilongjiangensis TaxID=1387883 RepID=A0A2N7THK5_9GAMM|nr:hypothetical protein [Halomonas heilongjiangensis]PMR67665.1 hypothetical protein C1H66_18605 [Halomonas heilongjiangensis]
MKPVKLRKMSTMALGVTLASALSFGVSAAAVDFPERGLTYVNSFNPGGEIDVTARMQQPLLEEYFGQRIDD